MVYGFNCVSHIEEEATREHTLENKIFYLAEYDRGYSIGIITSNDTLELTYIEDEEKAGAFIDRFERIK